MAYLHVPLSEKSQELCTFTVGHKSYSFLRVLFGFVNSSHIFGHAISLVLGDLLYKYLEHFVDDLMIVSPSVEQHIKDVAKVPDHLSAAGFTVEPKKSDFFKTLVIYLGYVLEANGVKTDLTLVTKILNFP